MSITISLNTTVLKYNRFIRNISLASVKSKTTLYIESQFQDRFIFSCILSSLYIYVLGKIVLFSVAQSFMKPKQIITPGQKYIYSFKFIIFTEIRVKISQLRCYCFQYNNSINSGRSTHISTKKKNERNKFHNRINRHQRHIPVKMQCLCYHNVKCRHSDLSFRQRMLQHTP